MFYGIPLSLFENVDWHSLSASAGNVSPQYLLKGYKKVI